MKAYDIAALAVGARAADPTRPATAVVHDAADARLVVFRLAPGQRVPPHTSGSTVILSVREGMGIVSGGEGEREVGPGEVVAFEPGELHGMRALAEQFVLLAIIAPRPRDR